MAHFVGKIVNVSTKGVTKGVNVPIAARNYTAVVTAYDPVLPFVTPSNIVRTDQMLLTFDKPGEPHTHRFKFDACDYAVPVKVGREAEFFQWPYPVPYMTRVAVELTLVGDEVAVKNVTETKKIVSETNKVYYKKHGVEDAKFIEIVQNEVVYVQPDDRVFLCDVNHLNKTKHVDYSFTVRLSEVMERKYSPPMTRIENYARNHYLVKKDGTSKDVQGGVVID